MTFHHPPFSFVIVLTMLASHLTVGAEEFEGVGAEGGPESVRPLQTEFEGKWLGQAICFGPYRSGQQPGGAVPSSEQLREDLLIVGRHWHLLRTYGSTMFVHDMLKVMRDDELPLKVMLGAWIEPEMQEINGRPELNSSAKQDNQSQVEKLIQLANEFEDFVITVSVGNETQVSWSNHKVPEDLLIKYLREVRLKTTVPVTTADDFLFWSDASSERIANEVDFITTHIHPVWHAQEAENALAFVREKYDLVRRAHPNRFVVIGETGWATQKNPTGREAEHVKGRMGEAEQSLACNQILQWCKTEKVVTFMFEAFDEAWKGADHPDEVEKHWGLYDGDRKPKAVMKDISASLR